MTRKGLVYVIGNSAYPNYYKIGYTTNLKKRLSQFNDNSGVCSSYIVYMIMYTNESSYDKVIHQMLDLLNPNLRVKQDKLGKISNTEFYEIPLDIIWDFFYGVARVNKSPTDLYSVISKDGVLYKYNQYEKMTLLFDEEDVNSDYELRNPVRKKEILSTDYLSDWWEDEGSQVDYAWDRIPWVLLCGSYKWWLRQKGIADNISLTKFTREFKAKVLPGLTGWSDNNGNKFRVTFSWNVPEPLIGKYDIEELKNPNYSGDDWYKIGSNGGQYKINYRGIVRMGSVFSTADVKDRKTD